MTTKMIMTIHEGLRLVSKVDEGMLGRFRQLTMDDIGRDFYYDRYGGPPWIKFITGDEELVEVTTDGPVSNDEHYARLNVYPAQPVVGERWEIDAETYWYFLEVLPPMDWKRGPGVESFLMSEMHDDDVTSKYSHEWDDGSGDRYFHEWVRVEREVRINHEMGW